MKPIALLMLLGVLNICFAAEYWYPSTGKEITYYEITKDALYISLEGEGGQYILNKNMSQFSDLSSTEKQLLLNRMLAVVIDAYNNNKKIKIYRTGTKFDIYESFTRIAIP